MFWWNLNVAPFVVCLFVNVCSVVVSIVFSNLYLGYDSFLVNFGYCVFCSKGCRLFLKSLLLLSDAYAKCFVFLLITGCRCISITPKQRNLNCHTIALVIVHQIRFAKSTEDVLTLRKPWVMKKQKNGSHVVIGLRGIDTPCLWCILDADLDIFFVAAALRPRSGCSRSTRYTDHRCKFCTSLCICLFVMKFIIAISQPLIEEWRWNLVRWDFLQCLISCIEGFLIKGLCREKFEKKSTTKSLVASCALWARWWW